MRGKPDEEKLSDDSNSFNGNSRDEDDVKWGINGSFVSVERRMSQIERIKTQNRQNDAIQDDS